MDNKEPLVSVVLLNWNGIDDTKICLKYLKKQTYKNYEIIVVDNGSIDKSLDYLKKINGIKLISNKINRGFTGGHIDGLRHANGEFILLLNNDAVMKPDLIEKAIFNFSNENVAVVGGRAYFWNKTNPLFNEDNSFYSYQYINAETAEAIFYQKDYGAPEEVNNVSGSCVMIRKSIIDEVGYLNNRFFAYYEECDLFARIKRSGYKVIYDPKVCIWHKVAASSNRKSSSFMYYMLFRNRFFFAVNNFQSGYLRKFLINYTKFGIKSIVKWAINRGDKTINKSFAKAFLYNLFALPKSLIERLKLNNKLGKSNYNSQILAEQINISHVTVANNNKEINQLINASTTLRPSHELVIVCSNKIITNSDKHDALPNNVRFCIDKGYFDTRPENYGVLISRYDWISFTDLSTIMNNSYKQYVDECIGKLLKYNKKCVVAAKNSITLESLKFKFNAPVIINRQIFTDIYGMHRDYSVNESLISFIFYSLLTKSLLLLPNYSRNYISVQLSTDKKKDIIKFTRNRISASKQQKNHFYEPLFTRLYRLQQLRDLTNWIFSRDIKLHLKIARLKNLLKFSILINKSSLATELKHIHNELLLKNGTIETIFEQNKISKESFIRQSKNPSDTPVFIICRDRILHLRSLIDWLEKAKMNRIVFIDNDSKFPDIVEYLSKTKYQVLDMKRNIGHTVLWQQSIIPILVPDEYYIVTDPDVIPTSPSDSTLRHLYDVHHEFQNHLKVGLGLKIDDLPDRYALKNDVIKWESQFWKSELKTGIYEAGVDTTFALYKPFVYKYILHPSLRTGEPFTARHLPWYTDSSKLTREDIFYRLRANQSVNSWDSNNLPDRYKKELAKQQR